MSRTDRIALLLSLLAVLAGYLIAVRVYESMAHIEDEVAYVWQAQAIAGGELTLPSPPHPKSFLVPFVVDYEGKRFGKYPLGWPVMLALGVALGIRPLVNALLSGAAVWLTYRLGQKIFGDTVGLLAAGLTLSSPFFLMNSGTLLSHPMGLFLSVAFALAWLDAWDTERHKTKPAYWSWLAIVTAGLSMGLLAITRPLTAVGVLLPFALHGVYLLFRSDRQGRLRLVVFGLILLFFVGLHFLWQFAVTGDAGLNPYTLWWEYDKVGFGPDVGRKEG
ncbi:MAG: ArnT family glycosyltransferase, partial [Anaerolineales bacterium]